MDMSFAMVLVWLDWGTHAREIYAVVELGRFDNICLQFYHTFSLYLLFRRSVLYSPLSRVILLCLEFVSRGPSTALGSFVVFVDNSDFYRTLEIFRGEPN